jgi:hypothetical protein
MKENLQNIIEQFVDLLLPQLTQPEATVYIFFLRHSVIKGEREIRIGQRTLANAWMSSRTTETISRPHILRIVNGLEEKGVIKIGDTNRDGTLYAIFLPEEIASVKEKLSIAAVPVEEDYFKNAEKRKEIFERDKYICQYCGEKVTPENLTLDHLIPQSGGGKHTRDNLKTSCLICNSIKSGKTYEEAAPLLLKSIQERRTKNQNS